MLQLRCCNLSLFPLAPTRQWFKKWLIFHIQRSILRCLSPAWETFNELKKMFIVASAVLRTSHFSYLYNVCTEHRTRKHWRKDQPDPLKRAAIRFDEKEGKLIVPRARVMGYKVALQGVCLGMQFAVLDAPYLLLFFVSKSSLGSSSRRYVP